MAQSSSAAFADDKVDEGRRLAERSAKLMAEARAAYESIAAAESDDISTLADYADFLILTSDYDLAEKALLRAVDIDSEDASLWLKLGQAETSLGPNSEAHAIHALRRAASIEPKSDATARAFAALGALYQESGLYDFAREAYSKALEIDPGHVGSKLSLASLDAREGKFLEAKAAYESVENASIEYAPFIKQTLGVALVDFEKSRRWIPDTAETHLAYAELLVRVDRLQESYWPLNRSLALDDQNYVAWNLMGSVLRIMNQTKSAREAFSRSLALNPDQPRTQEAITALDAELQNQGGDAADQLSAPAQPSNTNAVTTDTSQTAAPSSPTSASTP